MPGKKNHEKREQPRQRRMHSFPGRILNYRVRSYTLFCVQLSTNFSTAYNIVAPVLVVFSQLGPSILVFFSFTFKCLNHNTGREVNQQIDPMPAIKSGTQKINAG